MPLAAIRVAIVEDCHDYREHLTALLQGEEGIACVGAHGNAESALRKLPAEAPDVLLLDLELPKLSGEACVRRMKELLPSAEILILTIHDGPAQIFKALEAGASGYILKPISSVRLLEAINEVRRGGSPMSSQIARLVIQTFHKRGASKKELSGLTPREEEILALLAKGYQSKEIADSLKISVRTVGTHLHNVYEKLHVGSRSQALAKLFRS